MAEATKLPVKTEKASLAASWMPFQNLPSAGGR